MTLQARLEALAGAIRDKINAVMPRLQPQGGTTGQVLAKTSATDYASSWQSAVLSFNTRTGAVTLGTADVTDALGYTPTSVVGLTGSQTLVAFKTGLGLVKADVGLGSVDNTADASKNVLSATKLTTARTINGVAFDGTASITINAVDATARIASSEKGAANGVAPLGSDSKIAATYLPAYVDDVLEYANLAAFPATGTSGIIYVTQDTNKTYRWSGSAYTEISSSPGSTDVVTEGSSNLYFTTARVLSTAATGLIDTAGTPAATDTLLTVLGKIKKGFFTDHSGQGGAVHAAVVAAGANGFMTGADKTKLDSVASGATANSTDANLRDRSTHTGTQSIATIAAAATARFFGRITAAGGAGEELTGTQATSLLDTFTTTLKGLVPAPGTSNTTDFLRRDGSWATPAGGAGSTTVTQTFTATGTYTPTAGMKYARVQVVAPGAGGGSGRRGAAASARSGGQGGAAGGYSEAWFSASQIGASQAVTIGLPGTGGAAVTVDSTNGNPGTGGGNCSFGTLLTATGGPVGTAAGITNVSAGSIGGRGTYEGQRACQTSVTAGLSGPPAIMGNGPGAGGSGGGISTADQAFSGAAGGRASAYTTSTVGFGGGAAAGTNGTSMGIIGEGAGGGAASATAAASPGATGGNYGAGGGGGGASANGFNSGAGGNGAPGIVVVEEFF